MLYPVAHSYVPNRGAQKKQVLLLLSSAFLT